MLCKLKTAVPRNPSKMAGHVSGACHQVPTPPAPPSPTPPPPPPPTPPPPTPPPAPQPKQPHIVFVLTDDQDGWLNGYDPVDGVKHMDQLDSRVRKNGMLFTNYYLAWVTRCPCVAAIWSSALLSSLPLQASLPLALSLRRWITSIGLFLVVAVCERHEQGVRLIAREEGRWGHPG